MKLYVDSREPGYVKAKFQSMALDYDDLEVEIAALETGDFLWEYGIIERKGIEDLISAMTTNKERKDGSVYNRLTEQLTRLKELEVPIKILLIHGDLKDVHSNIHPHSVLGQIASIQAQGVSVLWIPDRIDYPYLIYRILAKSIKYKGG